ncbi:MAG: 30S ribosomal protein S16 [Nitrospinae bacterium]|nr:30S ribosomal protein S16 [Nitrospinota bacterium]
MPVILRLSREGAKKKPFYHIVATDSRSPRDGKYLEAIGTYDPKKESEGVKIDRAKLEKWIQKGAQISDTVRNILPKKE